MLTLFEHRETTLSAPLLTSTDVLTALVGFEVSEEPTTASPSPAVSSVVRSAAGTAVGGVAGAPTAASHSTQGGQHQPQQQAAAAAQQQQATAGVIAAAGLPPKAPLQAGSSNSSSGRPHGRPPTLQLPTLWADGVTGANSPSPGRSVSTPGRTNGGGGTRQLHISVSRHQLIRGRASLDTASGVVCASPRLLSHGVPMSPRLLSHAAVQQQHRRLHTLGGAVGSVEGAASGAAVGLKQQQGGATTATGVAGEEQQQPRAGGGQTPAAAPAAPGSCGQPPQGSSHGAGGWPSGSVRGGETSSIGTHQQR